MISPLFLSSYKSDLAHIITLCYGCRKIQLTAEAFCDSAVTAHSMITKQLNFLVAAALLLPCFYQRAIVEIYIKMIVIALLNIHFKNPLSRFAKQSLLKSLK